MNCILVAPGKIMHKLAIERKVLFKLGFVLLDGRFALCCMSFGGRAKG